MPIEMLNSKAPEFSLQATTGQKISLADLRGSFVVLVFYPANDTPVCNAQLDDMSMNMQRFLELNARVFGVNTASKEKHVEYCTRRRLEFPILSDPGGQTAKAYQAYWSWFATNKRTVVAIDPEANICLFERGKPDPAEVLKAIETATNRLAGKLQVE